MMKNVPGVANAALLLCLSVAAGGAHAAEGWFGGLNINPWLNRADALLNVDRAERSDNPARKRPGSAATGRRFDLELGYADAGGDNGVSANRPASATRDFRFAGVGVWSLGDSFGLTGRFGAYRGDLDGGGLYRLTPDSTLHPTYGMGLRYDISANLRLQGGWDRYHLGQSLRPGDAGVDLLTIGLKYRF
jgi:hypothetical protein